MTDQKTILIVDDSPDDLTLLREAFLQVNCHHALQEAHNGEEVIAYLNGEGLYSDRSQYPLPSLVLMDLNMPRVNGYDVLAWVRAQPSLRYLQIYVLSASMRPEDVQRAYYLGATGYLVKPSRLETLIDMARSVSDWVAINHVPLVEQPKGAGIALEKISSPAF